MSETSKNDWPNSFDFETDEVCQDIFKPFIIEQMDKLKNFDEAREENFSGEITYIFHEHAQRVAGNIKKTCLHLGLSDTISNNMYWAALPHDIGKSRLPVDIWDSEEKPTGDLKSFRRTHTLLGAQMVAEYFHDIEHPFKDLMSEIMANHHEQMDGQGTHEVPGDQLSMPVRLSAIIEAYDGWRIWRPHYEDRDITPAGVLNRMRKEKAHMFDMDLFEAFAEMRLSEPSA